MTRSNSASQDAFEMNWKGVGVRTLLRLTEPRSENGHEFFGHALKPTWVRAKGSKAILAWKGIPGWGGQGGWREHRGAMFPSARGFREQERQLKPHNCQKMQSHFNLTMNNRVNHRWVMDDRQNVDYETQNYQ